MTGNYSSRNQTSSTASSSDNVWCASTRGVVWSDRGKCYSQNGKALLTKESADAEYKRLKSSPSKASSSGLGYVWCATVEDVNFVRLSTCRSKGGQSFSSDKFRAQAEHKRLKGGSSTASSSSSGSVWCATRNTVSKMYSKQTCRNLGGKVYSSKYQAETEHKRLKRGSSTALSSSNSSTSSSSSTQALQVCLADVEREYKQLQFIAAMGGASGSNAPSNYRERGRRKCHRDFSS